MEEKPPSFEQCLVQYRDQHLPARNFVPKTRREYLADLAQLLAFVTNACALTSPRVEKRHLEGFLAELDRRGLRGSSRRRKVASAKSFFHYRPEPDAFGPLSGPPFTAASPSQKLIPPGRERLQPRVLSEGESKRLQLCCAHDVRDATVIELILQTGIRLSEAAALTTAGVELPARVSREGPPGSVRVHGKGRKERMVTVNWRARKALKAWLAIRPTNRGDALFFTKFRRPLGLRGIQHLARKHLRDAGISGASVRSLRHTFGTHMVRKGVHLDVIRKALGHESLDTTSIHVSGQARR